MASVLSQYFNKIKGWIAWSWAYLLFIWILLVVFMIYMLRGPLRLGETVTQGMFIGR